MIITLCTTSLIVIRASYFRTFKHLQHLGLVPDDCLVSHQFSEQLTNPHLCIWASCFATSLIAFSTPELPHKSILRSCQPCGTNSVTPGGWESSARATFPVFLQEQSRTSVLKPGKALPTFRADTTTSTMNPNVCLIRWECHSDNSSTNFY